MSKTTAQSSSCHGGLSIARVGKLIAKSNFAGYDLCLNPYVGCGFGCSYCYVRAFIRDSNHDWGDFVRVRLHIADKLPKELDAGSFKVEMGREVVTDANGDKILTDTGKPKKRTIFKTIPIHKARLVLGTMTDPYQPVEHQYRLTGKALQIITSHENQFQKVGIFTRSHLVLDDIDLIKLLPNGRVHVTVTPFSPKVLHAIEPYSPSTQKRWEVVKRLKEAGLTVHVNVSPVIPILSDGYEEEFIDRLIEYQVDEYFVDPMQPYDESWQAFAVDASRISGISFGDIKEIMLDKHRYNAWKVQYYQKWDAYRQTVQHKASSQLPIWSDHENRTWVNMLNGKQMDRRSYEED